MKEFVSVISEGLDQGLRRSEFLPVNVTSLVKANGLMFQEGLIKQLEDLEARRISNGNVSFSFPYPQLFELSMTTLVCGPTSIYELVDGSLTLRASNLIEGIPWSVADFGRFIILVNGIEVVIRDGDSLEFHVDNPLGLPVATSVCNYNGQAIFTAPTATIPNNSI